MTKTTIVSGEHNIDVTSIKAIEAQKPTEKINRADAIAGTLSGRQIFEKTIIILGNTEVLGDLIIKKDADISSAGNFNLTVHGNLIVEGGNIDRLNIVKAKAIRVNGKAIAEEFIAEDTIDVKGSLIDASGHKAKATAPIVKSGVEHLTEREKRSNKERKECRSGMKRKRKLRSTLRQ